MAGTVYEILLTSAVLGGVAVGLLGDAFARLTAPPPTASGPLALAVATVVVTGLGLAAMAVGPLVADPARAGWLLPAPVDRAGLLATSARTALALCTAGGAAGSLVVAGAAGWGLHPLAPVVGAPAGLAIGELALILQVHRAVAVRTAAVARALLMTALLAAGVVALTAAPGVAVPPRTGAADPATGVVAVVVPTVLCLALAVPARRAPRRIGVRDLAAGAPLLAAFRSGLLERGLVADVVRERRLRRRGPVRSRRLPAGRTAAAMTAAFVATGRHRSAVERVVAAAVVPHVVALVVPPLLLPTVLLGAVTTAASACSGALTTVARSPALRRALGGTDRAVPVACTVPPVVAAGLVTAAVAPVGGSLVTLTLLPVAAVAVVVRAATRPEPQLTSTLLDTPVGTLPVDQIRDRLVGGPGVFALCAIVLTMSG
ncbi:DUF6297 family protein [Pseudonocardia sp. HH130630-07]|uniref:DUF6297 family protein n=1 Tax=Pseudonocardia sp. HH130630-07 TaxID=1690815 RepID=UPI0012E9FA11|nr:DUF6297 family protein [Pseudonocardia sp. HH130630-07]